MVMKFFLAFHELIQVRLTNLYIGLVFFQTCDKVRVKLSA